MSRVYRAYDISQERLVAIKTLRTKGTGELEDIEREVRLLGRLRHENIVRLFDVGTSGDELFFAMELVNGVSLATFLDRPVPDTSEIRWVLGVAVKVLSALDSVHSAEWVHGDIKPSNVMVEVPADSPRTPEEALRIADPSVKLLDFGLARQSRSVSPGSGTPLYMSPEQLAAHGTFDGRSDLYSLGALLYHFITRRPPFRSLTEARLRRREPEPPRELNPDCDPRISAMVLRLLEREPHRRPTSAREALEDMLSLLDPHRRVVALSPRLLPPTFVGRAAELAMLYRHLEGAAAGKGSTIRIVGARGTGKTWLLEQSGLRTEATVELGMAQARGTFRRTGPVHQALRDVFQEMLRLVSADRGGEAVAEALDPWGPCLVETLGLEGTPLGQQDTSLSLEEGEGSISHSRVVRERLVQAALKVVRAASASRPLFIVLEDIQYADELEIEIISRLSRTLGSLPVALAATYRPESLRESAPPGRWIAELSEAGQAEPISLGSLGDREVKELLERMLRPAGRVPPDLVSLLERHSEGKPLPLVRHVQALWERGDIQLVGDTWGICEEAHGGPASSWPERIRSLDTADLSVVAGAVILSHPFEEELLERMGEDAGGSTAPAGPGDGTQAGLRTRLRSLVRRGFLVEDADGFSAPPDLDEDTLVASFPGSKLQELHGRAAAALIDWYGPASESHAFRIAEHFLRAGNGERALDFYLVAARAASRAYANQRGIDAYNKALDLCTRPEAKCRIAEELGELYTRVGSYPGALECFRLARSLRGDPEAPDRDARPEDLNLLDKIGRVLHRQGEFGEALAVFSRCLERSGQRTPGRARALFRIGGIHLDRGDPVTAERHLEESLKIYEELGDFHQMAAAQSGLGLAEKSQNRIEEAIQRFEEALANAERSGSLLDVATTLNNLGNIHRARGDDQGAVVCLRKSIEARERVGDRRGLAICLNNIARVHAYRGELAQARSATQSALDIFEEIGDKKGVLIARSNLGEMAHLQGEFRRAAELFLGNLEIAQRIKVQRLYETNLCNLGELELDRGNLEESMDYLRRSLKTLPADKPTELRAQALGSLAAVLLALHITEEAEEALREALEIATELKLREKLGVLVSHRVRLCVEKGDPEAAVEAGKSLAGEAGKGTDRYGAAQLQRQLGRAYREMGPDWADLTEKCLRTALRDFDEMKSPHNSAFTEIELGIYWKLQGEEEEALRLFGHAEETLQRLDLPRRLEELRSLRTTR